MNSFFIIGWHRFLNASSPSLICVIILVIVFLPVTIVLHVYSQLPFNYTWLRTIEFLLMAMLDKYFIVMAFITLLSAALVSDLFSTNLWFVIPGELLRKYIISVILSTLPFWFLIYFSEMYTIFDLVLIPAVSVLAFIFLCKKEFFYEFLGFILSCCLFLLVSYVFTIVKASVFFDGIILDNKIVQAENNIFGFSLYSEIAKWSAMHFKIVEFCDWIYYLFFHHIVLVGLFLFGLGNMREQLKYLSSLSLCYLLGGFLYHLYPAMGPAYYAPDEFLYLKSFAPKTLYFQDFLWRSTQEAVNGRLMKVETYAFIACMPSLHMAHETVMLFYSKWSPLMLMLSGFFWISSFMAVLVLGWHYLFDVIIGVIFSMTVILFVEFYKCNKNRILSNNISDL